MEGFCGPGESSMRFQDRRLSMALALYSIARLHVAFEECWEKSQAILPGICVTVIYKKYIFGHLDDQNTFLI